MRKNREVENMTMNKEELRALKEALEIVKKYDEETKGKLLNKKRTESLLQSINASLREREKTDLEHRIANIEITLSKLVNKENIK